MWRLWATFSCITIFFGLIISRLFYWQIIAGSSLAAAAASQYLLEFTIPAARGNIVSSDGSPLVMNQTAYLVYAEPKKIKDVNSFIEKTSSLLSLDLGWVRDQISQPGRVWVPLAHKIDGDRVQIVKESGVAGLGFEKEPKRLYPEASMAAHLLGFVGSDENGRDTGYFGLEGQYDRELRGKDGSIQIEKDVNGAPILIGDAKRIEPTNGRTLALWLDRSVQRIVEKRLIAGIRLYGAKEGSVVVLDPTSGGIIAMASYPSYDPAKFGSFDKTLYKNPVVGSSYEPGSTFKTLVMSAGIDKKIITAMTTMDETGPVGVGEYVIRTWNNEYRGTITMTDVLTHSSNVGMVFIGKKLGKEPLLSYIRSFGFGDITGIDLEDEASPDLRSDRDWGEIDLATASFGQGIAVTPLQMVRAVSAIANGGMLMEPKVVKAIIDENGKRTDLAPKRARQVVSAAAAKVVTEMMVASVDNGEAKWAKPKGYRIAGKTGTAQIPVAGHYDETKTIASFVGFAPADIPKFVMLVTLREPTSSQWGSETAAPLFFTIARDLFTYYGIPAQ